MQPLLKARVRLFEALCILKLPALYEEGVDLLLIEVLTIDVPLN